MDNKFIKENSTLLNDHDLIFTKEDRNKTFNKIHDKAHKKQTNTFFHQVKRYIGPALGSLIVLILAAGLILPTLFAGNEATEENNPIQQAAQQVENSFSVLLLGEDSTDDSPGRSSITILLTYNGRDNSMNIVPIPRDTYVDIYNAEGEVISKDKVMHTYALNANPESVLKTVSNLFDDIPIDYYAIFPEADLYKELGISKQDARENRYSIDDLADLMKENLTPSQVESLLEASETNIPSEIVTKNIDNYEGSMQVIPLEEGLEETFIDGIYYVEIDPAILETTSNTLKEHMEGE